MLLFLQLLTNSLDTSLNCISDVYEFPVTMHNKREEEKDAVGPGWFVYVIYAGKQKYFCFVCVNLQIGEFDDLVLLWSIS